ncbi:hypothetical protein ARSEF1564_008167 [Beauveria bassiana]
MSPSLVNRIDAIVKEPATFTLDIVLCSLQEVAAHVASYLECPNCCTSWPRLMNLAMLHQRQVALMCVIAKSPSAFIGGPASDNLRFTLGLYQLSEENNAMFKRLVIPSTARNIDHLVANFDDSIRAHQDLELTASVVSETESAKLNLRWLLDFSRNPKSRLKAIICILEKPELAHIEDVFEINFSRSGITYFITDYDPESAYTSEQGSAVKEELDSLAANPPPTPTTEPIPNGGWKAWLQVFGAHLLFFNSWGIVNTFGAYQAYYESGLLRSHSGYQISWICTIQGFLLILFSTISGPIFDLGYHRALLVSGTCLVVFGIMMTSLATQYWQLFLAQGLVVGLGAGCLFLPSVSIVATYFTTKRALVTGIVAAGGSIASVIYPIVFQKLLSQVGFAWAIPQKSRALLDPSAFVSAPFDALCLGLVLAFIGLYVPFFHVIIYAQSKLKFDGDILLYLLSVLNAASVAG